MKKLSLPSLKFAISVQKSAGDFRFALRNDRAVHPGILMDIKYQKCRPNPWDDPGSSPKIVKIAYQGNLGLSSASTQLLYALG